ncbi:gamma-glutamylcyclotransferase [Roseomonas sp. M0104]|uniref:glutathione-specific gamma-glutamylcyclotransferase n=1 Tax=Teichococcus coralli TaxID=2545983 RepID=A0A845B7M9_9PROT|nr:gamma-glutamylcyclotransferase [Pseudoroseomonas coralli]MXP63643.1 gamma-glutamylcyclotransferase [Pseudoroseomonas coralli]
MTQPLPAGLLDPDGDLYVFGYGSLIWKPGFAYAARHPALLRGFHRRFCLWSREYRGTPDCPGLVLGLDRGGACRGVAFRVPASAAPEVLAYLDAREMISDHYQRRRLPVRLLDQGVVRQAVTFVANRQGQAYCREMTPEQAAAAIALGRGRMGPNREYLLNTVTHLRRLGVHDAALNRIAALLPAGPTD